MNDVCRVGETVFDRRKTVLLFVPGVMGSRIKLTKSKRYWDPDSMLRMAGWLLGDMQKCARDISWKEPGVVLGNDDKNSPKLKESEKERGWSGLVESFYISFLRHLTAQCYQGRECSVYAVGYDWRQSIWNPGGNNVNSSAQHLLNEIEKILKKEFKRKEDQEMVIITHSMGGLVTRAALKAKPAIESKVAGVVHVVQPVNGAPVAHRRFFTGALKEHVDPGELAHILGNTSAKFAAMMHGLPGPMQLLPNDSYRNKLKPWLLFKESGKWQTWSGNVYDLYKKVDGPPGLILHAEYDGKHGKLKKVKYKNHLMNQVDQAKNFHNWLNSMGPIKGPIDLSAAGGTYKHPNTYAIFATNLETDMACAFSPYKKPSTSGRDNEEALKAHQHWVSWRGLHRQRFDQGDGTVPDSSGDALFPFQHHPPSKVTDSVVSESPRQVKLDGVEHGAAFSDSSVRKTVDRWINRILFMNGLNKIKKNSQ